MLLKYHKSFQFCILCIEAIACLQFTVFIEFNTTSGSRCGVMQRFRLSKKNIFVDLPAKKKLQKNVHEAAVKVFTTLHFF